MKNSHSLPPRWIVRFLGWFRSRLMHLHQSIFPGTVVLYEKFQSLYLLPPLYVAAELNLAALLGNGKRPVEEVAREAGVDEASLYRIFRVLASHSIFREYPGRIFANTSLSRPLADGPGSMRQALRHHLGPLNWIMLGDLLETVRTGSDAFTRKFGRNIYDYLAGDPGNMQLFDQSMADFADLGLFPLLQAYDFSRFTTLADIGCGEGIVLANIVQSAPGLRGILFDLPEALNGASMTLQRYGVADRMTMVTGSFFDSVPAGADGYLLKHILHNWDDAQCITILNRIRDAMPEHGKLLIIEMLIPPGNAPSAAKMLDIQMLSSMPGGKERTLQEYTTLLRQAGLQLVRVVPTIAPISVLEARHYR